MLLKNMIALEMPTVHKLSDHALAIKSGKSIQRFELVTVEGHNYKQYYFYTVEDSRIVGWKMTGESAKEIWTFYVGKDERIIATASAFRG